MAKTDLGTKRACPGCGARFYDLNKVPAECPECETVFNPDEFARGRKTRSTGDTKSTTKAKAPAAKKKKSEEPEEEEELEGVKVGDVETDDDDDDEDIIEDTSDLGDDDMSEVIENVDKKDDET